MKDRGLLPGWLRFLKPFTAVVSFLVVWLAAINIVAPLYHYLHPARQMSSGEGLLMTLPMMVAAMFAGMLVSNAIFFKIPAVRRVLDEAMRDAVSARLWKTARWVVPVCVAISVLGAIAPWAE